MFIVSEPRFSRHPLRHVSDYHASCQKFYRNMYECGAFLLKHAYRYSCFLAE